MKRRAFRPILAILEERQLLSGSLINLQWPTPAPIVYGTPITNTQLNASATLTFNNTNVPVIGTYTYSTPVGTILHAGAQELDVAFTPTYGDIGTITSSVTLDVTPAPLTIAANPTTEVYGTTQTLTASISGLVNNDDPSVLGPITLNATGTTVGTYQINVSGANDPDYAPTYVPGTLTITPASLLITPISTTKVYGAALPTLTLSYSGLVNGDTGPAVQPTLATTATPDSPVGEYPIFAIGAGDPDYNVICMPGTLTVTPAPLIVTANSITKAYGASTPTLTASYSGLVNGDAGPTPVLVTTATEASPPGNYLIMAAGAYNPDYTIDYVPGLLTVTKAPLTITANDATQTYGDPTPSLTVSYDGFVNDDTIGDIVQPTLSTTASASSPVGTYSITASGAVSTDYDIAYVDGTLTITQAQLTITANSTTKVYGSVPVLTATIAGLVNNDVVHPTLSTTASASSPVGDYTITASGAVNDNYMINYIDGTLTVTPASLTITASDKSMTYGSSVPALTDTITGFVNGDGAGVVSGTPGLSTTASSSSHPGSYPITVDVSGLSAANYSFVGQDGTLTIGTATPVLTWMNPADHHLRHGVGRHAVGCHRLLHRLGARSACPERSPTRRPRGPSSARATRRSRSASPPPTPPTTPPRPPQRPSTSTRRRRRSPGIRRPSSTGRRWAPRSLDATASVPGTFVYTPAAGTVLTAGAGQTLSVTFTPTDTADYNPVTTTATINVQQADAGAHLGEPRRHHLRHGAGRHPA